MNHEKVAMLRRHLKYLLYQLCDEMGADYAAALEALLWELDGDIKKTMERMKPRLRVLE